MNILRIILAGIVISALTACGGGGDDEDARQPNPPVNCEVDRYKCV